MTVPLKVYAELRLGRKIQELKKEVQIARNIKGVSGEAKINMVGGGGEEQEMIRSEK